MASSESSCFAPDREAIVRALVDLVAERGYTRTTIEMVLLRAGVDREAFDRHFRDGADCVVSVWGEISQECVSDLTDAYRGEATWLEGIRAMLYCAVSAAGRDPNRASFGVEALVAGKAARTRRDMTLRALAALIDAGRRETDDPDLISPLTGEALAGAIYYQVQAKIAAGAHSELLSLVPELISSIALSYLGPDAVSTELSASAPVEDAPPAVSNGLGVTSPGEFASRGKRERLIAGFADAVRSYGYEGATIDRIAGAAAVSPRTFYLYFAGKAACLEAAFDSVIGELRTRVEDEFNAEGRWPSGLPAGISAMLEFLAAEPALAHLCLVEALAKGRGGARRHEKAIQSFAPFFSADEVLAEGVMSVITRRVKAGETRQLEKLLPDLTVFALGPHIGLAEAECLANA